MDFSDVKQIISLHIYRKWEQYDPNKGDVGAWANTIISNQIKNLRRNLFDTISRPCLRCAAAEGDELCAIYQKQCSACPLFRRWEKTKKSAHDIKLPVAQEFHFNEISEMPNINGDITKLEAELHEHMLKILKPIEAKVYQLIYIQGISEEKTLKILRNSFRDSQININKIKKNIIYHAKLSLVENKDKEML